MLQRIYEYSVSEITVKNIVCTHIEECGEQWEKAPFPKNRMTLLAVAHGECELFSQRGRVNLHVGEAALVGGEDCVKHIAGSQDFGFDGVNPLAVYEVSFEVRLGGLPANLLFDTPKKAEFEQKSEFFDCLEGLIALNGAQDCASALRRSSMVLKLLAAYFSAGEPKPYIPTDARIDRAEQWMQENLDKELSVSKLAERLKLHPNSLSRLFKEQTGRSPKAYFAALRMDWACRLLLNTNLKVGEVITKCGFSDHSGFFKQFKRHTGCTPAEYRIHFLGAAVKSESAQR